MHSSSNNTGARMNAFPDAWIKIQQLPNVDAWRAFTQGLSSAEVVRRLDEYGPNRVEEVARRVGGKRLSTVNSTPEGPTLYCNCAR